MSKPGIYRQEMTWEKDFTTMPNAWIRDERISFKAKGLLQYLLSHNIGYGLTIAQIERQTKDGTASIRSALDELVDAGYLTTEHTKDVRGYNSGLRYELLNPECENPSLENPSLENPSLENRTAYKKTNIKENNNKENKDIRTNARIEREFESFYNLYPRKVARGRAKAAYVKALKRTDPETLIAGLQNWVDKTQITDKRFIPHPDAWLNADRWLDEDFTTIIDKHKPLDKEAERAAQLARMLERERLEDEQNAT